MATPNPFNSPNSSFFTQARSPSKLLNDSLISESRWNDLEYIRLRKQVKDLEFQLSKCQRENEDLRIEAEGQKQDAQRQLTESWAKIERLEKDRRFLYEREKDASLKVAEFFTEISRLKGENQKSSSCSQKERNQLQEQLSRLQESFRSLQSESKNQSLMYKTLLEARDNEVKHLQDELNKQSEGKDNLRTKLQEMQNKLDETESNLRYHRRRSERVEDISIAQKGLQDQIAYVESLEKQVNTLTAEVTKHRTERQNLEFLREEKMELENQVAMMDDFKAKVTKLEVENDLLNSERAQWSTFLELQPDSVGIKTPYQLAKVLAEERIELAYLKDRQGLLNADLNAKDALIVELDTEIRNLRNELTLMDTKYQREMKNNKRMEKSRELVQKEVEFLREQLRSYDNEEASFMNNYDLQKTKRIEEMDKLLDSYRRQVKELSTEICEKVKRELPPFETAWDQKLEGGLSGLLKEKKKVEESVAALTKENQMLTKTIESLDKQVGLLEHAVGRGEYNPQTTRVLELAHNPSSQDFIIRSTTLANLRNENDKLINRIQELETILRSDPFSVVEFKGSKRLRLHGAENENEVSEEGGWIPIESYRNLKVENEALEAVVNEKEKRMMRLKEVWNGKALEFREAVYSLLGYRIDFLSNGRVKLTSMYSPSPDHSFHFSSDSDSSISDGKMDREGTGTMQLIGGGNDQFVNSLDELIRFWLVEKSSIPCFLSSVTLELWRERTEGKSSSRGVAGAGG